MLNDIGAPAILSVRNGTTEDRYGNDVPVMVSVELANVYVYTQSGASEGMVGNYLMVDSDAMALLPIGTAARLDSIIGGHSLAGATLEQNGSVYKVNGSPLKFPDGTSPYSWEWAVPLTEVTG